MENYNCANLRYCTEPIDVQATLQIGDPDVTKKHRNIIFFYENFSGERILSMHFFNGLFYTITIIVDLQAVEYS